MNIYDYLKKNQKIKKLFSQLNKTRMFRELYYYRRTEERYISQSNIKEQHYYIIRRKALGGGFFSNWMNIVTHLCYADKHNYIPVIDQQNYVTEYNENEKIRNTYNAWEYYYHQPTGIKLEDVYKSNNYILSDLSFHSEFSPFLEDAADHYEIIEERLHNLSAVVNKYLFLQDDIRMELIRRWNNVPGNCNVIGVHVRTTDKKIYHPGHYISPEVEKYMDVIDDLLSRKPGSRIFLCCDEKSTIDLFEERYHGFLFYNVAYRAKAGSIVGIHLERNVHIRNNHKYLLGLEVLLDAYMLSFCNDLVHSHSNVTDAAIILKANHYNDRIFIG